MKPLTRSSRCRPRTRSARARAAPLREALRVILFVLRTWIPWQALPIGAFGLSGSSCGRRFDEWSQAGVWAVHPRLLNLLGRGGGANLDRVVVDSQSVHAVKGGRQRRPQPIDRGTEGCKRHVLTEAKGVPLVVRTTAAKVNDETQLPALLEGIPPVRGPRGRLWRKPGSIFGDLAYGTVAMVALVLALGIFSVLAPRNDKGHGSGLGFFRYVGERTLACSSAILLPLKSDGHFGSGCIYFAGKLESCRQQGRRLRASLVCTVLLRRNGGYPQFLCVAASGLCDRSGIQNPYPVP